MVSEAVGLEIMAGEMWATAAAAASAWVAIVGTDAANTACAVVAIVGYLCLEVRDCVHDGLYLFHHGLVLLGR